MRDVTQPRSSPAAAGAAAAELPEPRCGVRGAERFFDERRRESESEERANKERRAKSGGPCLLVPAAAESRERERERETDALVLVLVRCSLLLGDF